MDIQFPPVVISYKGLEADSHLIELGQLGQSIQGASKLLGIAAHIVTTGQYAKRAPALTVRVLAQEPIAGSFDLVAVLMPITPMVAPMLPLIADQTRALAGRAVEGIVNYAISKFAARQTDADRAMQIADSALTEMGQVSRAAIAAMERVALNEKPAAKLLVVPIGQSCETAQIGALANGALAIDRNMRNVIDGADSAVVIGPEASFDIFITELDLKNKTCKFQVRGAEDDEQRLVGEITDPALTIPHNPYSSAMDNRRWLQVSGKPEIRDGDIERLYISNAPSA
ncbi:MAG: hypothetical protein WAM55_07705 [Methylovirgula sp.]